MQRIVNGVKEIDSDMILPYFIVHSLAFHPEPAGNEEFSRLHIIRHRYGQTLNMDVMPLKPVEPIVLPAGIGKIYRIIIIPVHRPVVFFHKAR
ncbi:hypothetical protein CEP62_002065 [Raoultella planticola]|nr:hypothetical protein CEP62_002065 [Raoultella planticola]